MQVFYDHNILFTVADVLTYFFTSMEFPFFGYSNQKIFIFVSLGKTQNTVTVLEVKYVQSQYLWKSFW